MNNAGADGDIPVVKDESKELPVPSAWRPALCAIVNAFAQGDFFLKRAPTGVASVPPDIAAQIEKYLAAYGARLIPLPEDTWKTSVSQWMGDGWDVLVDLWTLEEGRSDMVLSAHVSEILDGFEYHVQMVYVP